MKVYLIGSLRNPKLPLFGNELRAIGIDVFDDWWGAGELADDSWRQHETIKGRSFEEALGSRWVEHIVEFDLEHLNSSDVGVLMLPAGRSGHLELGFLIGRNKLTYVLFDGEPYNRWDIMYNLATKVFLSQDLLLEELRKAQEYGYFT